MLVELNLELPDQPLTEAALALIAEGRSRFERVSCFEFVPSDYELVWRWLTAVGGADIDGPVERQRFCEWGSGFGIATGLAELLGMDAVGIEMEPNLVAEATQLLVEFGLQARFLTGSYLEIVLPADIYFVYCWPGKIKETEEWFEETATPGAKLLICYGQSQIVCKMRQRDCEIRNR